jgi:hypothetical protein
MQQEMGINKLANMFMGNPQPLANKVQQDQQQAKPGQIPPDLAEAIALQKIQEMHQAAQNQQAMQAGGPQPTIMDKLRQMVQPQMQGQPQGGMPAQMAQAPQGMPQGQQPMPPQGMPQGMPPVQAAHGGHIAQLQSNLSHHYDGGGIVAFSGGGMGAADEGNAGEEEARTGMQERLAQPSVGENATGTAPARAPMSFKETIEKNILAPLNRDPNKERDEGAAYYRNTVGLDALLKEQEARAAAREARYKEAQANRTPEWVRGLQALGGAPIRGGLGMMLAQAGRGAVSARDEYAQADAKFAEDQDRLRDVISKAKIEGNMAVANAGIAALKELKDQQRTALTSGSGLQTERERVDSAEKVSAADRLSRERTSAASNAAQIAAANAPGQTERLAAKIQAIRNSNLPDAEKKIKIEQILGDISSITGSGAAGVGAQRNQIMEMRTELAAHQAILKDIDSTDEEKADARNAIKELTQAISNSRKTIKLEEPDMATKARNAPPPPAGFVVQKG